MQKLKEAEGGRRERRSRVQPSQGTGVVSMGKQTKLGAMQSDKTAQTLKSVTQKIAQRQGSMKPLLLAGLGYYSCLTGATSVVTSLAVSMT